MKINQGNFLYAISKIRQNLFAFLKMEMAEKNINDISPSDGDILFALDRRGSLTVQEIALLTVKDKSTISSVVTKLEEKGFVTKVRDEDDSRFVKIILTDKARKVKPVLWKISAAMNEKMFSGLTDAEKRQLFTLMEKIYNNL